jgi:hypothetical protein
MTDETQDQAAEGGWTKKILKAVIGASDDKEELSDAAQPAVSDASPPADVPLVDPHSLAGTNPQVDTLVGIIRELPPEVNRKTGAAIVRKTMAAMGVAVEDVLRDTGRVKASMTKEIELHRKTIEDCKRQIAQMESAIDSSQKKMTQLDEILELFK